jgi:Asp-tRNA(Asn)/Glu-tRNA(Gln) amidotransferase A subunit family amidase
MTDAKDLSALQARRAIGARRLSPVELLDDCIAQIERLNPAVNAVTATAFERARDEAKKAETAVVRGDALPPLHGLPVGIKDLNETEGLLTTYGSPMYADYVPTHDESMVANLRRNGAIVFCKTNVPVFGAGANTTNPVWGPTRNPFDTARICGGSSGGSAVALACNMMPLASGSDSGGSLRIPAAFCGVTAHRGTPGLVPTEKHVHGYTTNGVQGPMARSVDDTRFMLSVMARYDAGIDPLSSRIPPGEFDALAEVDLANLRVAVSEDLGATDVDSGIRETFRDRVATFGPAFAQLEQAHPDFANVRECYWTVRSTLFLSSFKDRYENHREDIGANARMNYEAGLALSAEQIAWANAEQTAIYRRTQAFFEDHDVLICPTVAVPPFAVEQLYCESINGQPLERYLDWLALTWILTTPGNPVTNVPCGVDHTGTPFGLQVVGPMHADRQVLGVAATLERHFAHADNTRRPVPDFDALAEAAR